MDKSIHPWQRAQRNNYDGSGGGVDALYLSVDHQLEDYLHIGIRYLWLESSRVGEHVLLHWYVAARRLIICILRSSR